MRRAAFLPLLGLALALPAAAQGPGVMPARAPMPGGGPMMMMMHGPGGPDAAGLLLSHTGALKLTDAQVVRLAAIARRAEERHQAMRTRMEAMHPPTGARTTTPDAEMQQMRQAMEQMREQSHADLRDALAVLTADQQATAFELASHAGPGAPGGPGGMRAMRHREGSRPGAVRTRRPDGPRPAEGRDAPPPPPRQP